MEIIEICTHVSNIVCLQHLIFYEKPFVRVKWEVHKDVAYCIKLILEQATGVRTLTSHLTYY